MTLHHLRIFFGAERLDPLPSRAERASARRAGMLRPSAEARKA
jgi:hypothetical protein